MLYVQQSLNPDEEIVCVGNFHWWYTFSSALSIVFGVVGLTLILYAGYYWEVFETVKQFVPGTTMLNPDKDGYWDAAVEYRGGMFEIIKSLHIGIKLAAFAVLALSILSFAQQMIIKATTEICLTTNRLVLKRGMVARHVIEINVDRIEGVEVFQGVFGRILGFGYLIVRGMGVGAIKIPRIEHPIEFRRAIERSRSLSSSRE